ncbi:MAG: Mu-like prophage major head subunit gpT family protein [Desulfobacca sp.]|nr:Mu-like prophage major head subunit gpT family protein [Desulfobacca sp.]
MRGLANLADIYRSARALFYETISQVPALYDKVAMVVPSTTSQNDYKWLGEVPMMSEWLGNRRIQDLKAYSYTLVNQEWANGITLHKNEVADDQLGMFTYLVKALAEQAANHINQQVFGLLPQGFGTACYDGQFFFDTDHPVGSGTQSNFGGGSGTAWYLFDTARVVKPLIFQKRSEVEFTSLDRAEDREVFMSGRYLYGANYRGSFGYGLWQLAYASKSTLDATNYALARSAMTAFTNDEGVPLGIMPNLLVVPPSLEAAAREILHADIILGDATSGGSKSNIWKSSAELIVVPWLT